MWEEIRANKRRSVFLVLAMTLVLSTLGGLIGASAAIYTGGSAEYGIDSAALAFGVMAGVALAIGIAALMSATAFYSGSSILLSLSHARAIDHDDYPQLYNVVEEMAIASGQATLPKVYIIDDNAMNAFATGRDPQHSAIAVTSGLLRRMNRDQLQGVIAHEMSHIHNRDILFMTMLSVMVGTIAILSETFLRAFIFAPRTGGRRSRSSSSNNGGGGAIMIAVIVITLLFAIIAPILSHIIYFAASRRREYLADASAALMTRYPEGLASALEVIEHESAPLASARKATAPMYITNPMEKAELKAIGATHPPTSERIRILRSMGASLSYGAYQQAWTAVAGAKADQIPASALADEQQFSVREPSGQKETLAQKKNDVRQVTDALRKADGFMFLACACGMRIKLPPEFKKDHIACPRCSRDVAVPTAHLATIAALGGALEGLSGGKGGKSTPPPLNTPQSQAPLEVERPAKGWFTFQCSCGAHNSLSPQFSLSTTKCKKCGRTIHIK